MTDQLEPRLKLTVPLSLWTQIARTVSPAFADSYLSGAQLSGDTLTPKTRIAYERLQMSPEATSILRGLGIHVAQPITAADTINRAWTWPTEAELGSMSLRERQRQFRIMAMQARFRAGHMHGTSKRDPEWLDKAENYEREVKRLGEMIAKGAQIREAAE